MRPRLLALVSAVTALTLAAVIWALWSRGGSPDDAGSAGHGPTSAGPAGAPTGTSVPGSSPSAPSVPAGVAGPACGDYAAAVPSGPGSIRAMAGEPVLAAISGSPLLRTFSSALTGRLNRHVDLTAELGRGPLTVFAPVDSAFALVPADRMSSLRRNASQLRLLLRGHLVAGSLDANHVGGAHRTLAGTTLRVAGSGGALTVDGSQVVCGGLRTTNGVIYLIGSVLPTR